MSLYSVTNADYVSEIASLREHIRLGTRPGDVELVLLIQLLLNASTRMSDAVTAFQAEMDILNEFEDTDPAADIVAAISDANDVWEDIVGGDLDAPAIAADAVKDGIRS